MILGSLSSTYSIFSLPPQTRPGQFYSIIILCGRFLFIPELHHSLDIIF